MVRLAKIWTRSPTHSDPLTKQRICEMSPDTVQRVIPSDTHEHLEVRR